MDNFANGVEFIYENEQKVVNNYYLDGAVNELIPPMRMLFDIVHNNGEFKGMTLSSPEFLDMFKRENVLKSDWYKARLIQAQRNEIRMLEKQIADFKQKKLAYEQLEARLNYVKTPQYVQDIIGSMGVHVWYQDDE